MKIENGHRVVQDHKQSLILVGKSGESYHVGIEIDITELKRGINQLEVEAGGPFLSSARDAMGVVVSVTRIVK